MNGVLSTVLLLASAAEPSEAMHWTADGKGFAFLLQYRLYAKHSNSEGRGITKGNTPEYSVLHTYGLIEKTDLLTQKVVDAARSNFYDCNELEGGFRTLEAEKRGCEKSMAEDREKWEANILKVRGSSATPATPSSFPPSGRASFETKGTPKGRVAVGAFDGGVIVADSPYDVPNDLELELVSPGRPAKVWARPKDASYSQIRFFWSPDEQWVVLLLSWSFVDEHSKVFAMPAIAKVDLLDAGGGAKTEELAKRLTAAQYAPAHQGKAKNVRPKTAIFVPPGFEPDGYAIAEVLGVSRDAVSPLMWSTPYAVTVAVGTDLAK